MFVKPVLQKDYFCAFNPICQMIEEVGENEGHPLSSLIETVGSLAETYEPANLPQPEGSPADVLNYLMQ